jgi:hypothetical protein
MEGQIRTNQRHETTVNVQQSHDQGFQLIGSRVNRNEERLDGMSNGGGLANEE